MVKGPVALGPLIFMKTLLPFLFVFCPLFSIASVSETVQVSRVIKIYDGDTITVDIDSWPSIVGEAIGIRIRGIDAPEIRGKCKEESELAIKARDYLRLMVTSAQKVYLSNIERGKYFRVIATVEADGVDVSEELLTAGLVRGYNGGKRLSWCE
jgi:micrococcal nuclease